MIAGLHYSRVLPHAMYSPWLGDAVFREAYELIKENTLVDQYRCHELWQLVEQVHNIDGDILEVGVWRGGTGCLMAQAAKIFMPNRKVFLCDTFAGVVKASERDPRYKGGEHRDTSRSIVEALVAGIDLPNISIQQGIFPDETGHAVSDRFNLVHIDVDVYDSARDVMDFVWPKLSMNGIVVFDDYGFLRCGGIARLVDEYRNDQDKLVLHNLNGHGIVVKLR